MRTILLGILVTFLSLTALAQDGMPACDGSLAVVRVSQIKSGGTMQGFMKAVAAQLAWYRSHGFQDNEIAASRVIVSGLPGGAKYSDKEVITYHLRPPGMGNPPGRGDTAWNAFVKLYQDNSDMKSEYVTCMPRFK